MEEHKETDISADDGFIYAPKCNITISIHRSKGFSACGLCLLKTPVHIEIKICLFVF